MALPNVEEEVVLEAATELKEEALDKAIALSGASSNTPTVVDRNVNVEQELLDQGFGHQELDFTSFLIVILDNAKFSTSENKNFGDEFDCILHSSSDSYLYVGSKGRDEEPVTAYSTDDIHVNGKDEPKKLIKDQVAEWEKAGYTVDRKVYKMVMAEMLTPPHENEFVFLQIPPTSQGKLAGYTTSLVVRKLRMDSVVTKVRVGATVGSGIKAFNPFTFKYSRKV